MRRRSLRALAHAARTGLLVGSFTAALAAGVVLHADLPAVRRLTAELGNGALGSLFAGSIVAHDVTSLSIGRRAHVRIREAEAKSPDGARVIVARDIEAEIDLARLFRSLSTSRSPDVELDGVRIGEAEVVLDRDATGSLSIERTFARRNAAAPAQTKRARRQTSAPEPVASSPIVHLQKVAVGSAHVHGNAVPPELDGDAAELHARVDLEKDVFTVTLDEGKVTLRAPRAPQQGAPLTGSVNGFFLADLGAKPTTFRSKIDLQGAAGEIPVTAHGEIDGDHVEATVDVVRTDPTALAKTFPDLRLTKSVALHAHAAGKLPTIKVDALATVGDSKITANGEIDVREGKAFSLDVDASHVDTSTFGTDIVSDLSGQVHAEGALGAGGGPQGTFRVTTSQGTLADQSIPASKIDGRFDAEKITAVLSAREPGVEATGKFDVDLAAHQGLKPTVTFDVQARSDSLRAVGRARNLATGSASARARGKIDLDAQTIQATTTFSGDNVGVSPISARHLSANGVLSGPLASPLLTVGFAGTDMRVAVPGQPPVVYPSASGNAKIALAEGPRVLGAEVNVASPGSGETITASVRGVRIKQGSVETEGLRVTGLGEPVELDAQVGNGTWNVRAKANAIDVRRAARLTGIKELQGLPEGTLATVDIDVRENGGVPDGHVDLLLRSEKALLGNAAVSAEVHANITHGKLLGTGRVQAEGVGQIEMTTAEVNLPRRLDKKSLQQATGAFELRGSIDLSQGAALFAGENVERIAGILSFDARIEKGDSANLPLVRATARTEGLEVAISTDPALPTLLISGVDVQAHAAWDGGTEDTELALMTWDKFGLVAHAGAKAKLPVVAWATGAQKIDRRMLANLAASAFVEMPTRELRDLPSFIGLPALRGKIEGRVAAEGTLAHPHVVASARATSIREDRRKIASVAGASFSPFDGVVEGRWDGDRAAVTFAVDERERRQRPPPNGSRGEQRPLPLPPEARNTKPRGHLRGLVLVNDLRVGSLLRSKSASDLPFVLSSELEVENLDVRPLAAAAGASGQLRKLVSGTMTGRFRVRDLNRNPTFEANASVDNFAVSGASVQKLDLTSNGADGSLFVRASIVDEQQAEPARITAQVTSKSLRIKGLDISWDAKAQTRLDYAVQNGRLALLAPLVKSAASDIAGRVDGTGSVTVDEASQVFEGGLAVQGARLYVNALGEEISSLDAIARFERSGEFRIDDARGKMGSGEFRASASGRMSGFQFMGAEATLIASKEGLPISSEGATFADATGEVKLTAKMSADRKTLDASLDLPRANVELPDRSTQELQSLNPDTTIATGVRRAGGALDTSAVRKNRGGTGGAAKQNADDAIAIHMNVDIGDDVHLTGRGLDIKLKGRLLVDVAQEVAVTGQIDLHGGTIEVHGRQFIVDRGTVTFAEGGDPTNPTVVAAAYWDAPDRTRIWGEFAGPLKANKLSLRSEPSYSPNEILSILLFGRPDPNSAVASGTGAAGAGAASGASGKTSGNNAQAGNANAATVATIGSLGLADINRELSRVDKDLDVETDTMSGNRTRLKVGQSFFDRRLKVQVAAAAGQATYREPDSYFVFLNWQFVPKWSVVAQRGDQGTSILDLLFQHRY